MKVRNTLLLLEYSQYIFVGVLVAVGFLISRNSTNPVLIAIVVVLSCAAIILFLFRSAIANRILKKSAHPGLIFAVLDKMGYADTYDLSLPEEFQNEINNPNYSTEELVKENGLRLKIDRALSFDEKGLQYKNQLIPWTRLYDWTYAKGGRYRSATIIINYYNETGEIQEDTIYLTLGRSAINILLLITHFKGKYGQVQPK